MRERNGNPRQYSCLENPVDRGASQATVHGILRVRHDLALSFFLSSFLIFFSFIFISWRLITLQYYIVFSIHWHESAMDLHVFPILNPPPSFLPIPSLWVFPVPQPWALSLMHPTWAGDLFHIWQHISFNAILSDNPTLAFSHRVQKSVLYICISFSVLPIRLSLPFF